MERNLLLELLEDGNKVSLYSPHFEGEAYSEFEKFLETTSLRLYLLNINAKVLILGNGGLKTTSTYIIISDEDKQNNGRDTGNHSSGVKDANGTFGGYSQSDL